MLDLDKIRHYYFNPPPDDPERVPTREELYASEERRAVERCLLGAATQESGDSASTGP